jgi:hypothetical protein
LTQIACDRKAKHASKEYLARRVRLAGKKAGCVWARARKHFFALIFLLLFVSRQKVKALEVFIQDFDY